MQELIWVDEQDNVVGYGEKMETHEKGILHRAFSIFIVNQKHQLMLQKRADHKYHSPGLWANTCCSHPLRGQDLDTTTHTRLMEEMGFDCEFARLFTFTYRAEFDNGLTEYEYDHVFLGRHEGEPNPNPDEVGDWKWMDLDELRRDIVGHPDRYVYWLKAAFEEFCQRYWELG